MADRPQLSKNLDPNTFRNFYYLKEELVAFCKKQGLPAGGGKLELTERIACYLSTGEAPPAPAPAPARAKAPAGPITPETPIEPDFVCSERHRAFFRGQLGPGFSFNVPFQKWLKANAGKTYRQAAEAYLLLLEEKKAGKPPIDKQFEYNTYIRDFFAANPGKTLPQAILCWKRKKALAGHNRYEAADLAALNE